MREELKEFEIISRPGDKFYDYTFKHPNGRVFTIVTDELGSCRYHRDLWIERNHFKMVTDTTNIEAHLKTEI